MPSSYLSLLEEPARGSLPLDVAPAEQHKDRQTRNEDGQKSADDSGGDHGKARAERHGEAHFKHATSKLKCCQSIAGNVSPVHLLTFYPGSQRDQAQSTCRDMKLGKIEISPAAV